MKTLAKLAIPLCFAAFGYAETWNAKLLDAGCYDKNSPSGGQATQTADKKSREKMSQSCAPTATTTAFAIQTSNGKVYKLDDAGNAKAASTMQSGSLKADHDGDVHVSVNGSLQGDTVKLDSISSHGK